MRCRLCVDARRLGKVDYGFYLGDRAHLGQQARGNCSSAGEEGSDKREAGAAQQQRDRAGGDDPLQRGGLTSRAQSDAYRHKVRELNDADAGKPAQPQRSS